MPGYKLMSFISDSAAASTSVVVTEKDVMTLVSELEVSKDRARALLLQSGGDLRAALIDYIHHRET
jgi:NACalpha-BTF3-like transcription factor